MLIPRVVFLAFSLALAARAQQPAPADRDKGVQSRGDHVMGFSHEKTTHHFRLYADGGAIEVTANDPADRSAVANQDAASRDQIRMHLRHIAEMFSEGHFAAPMLIHAQNPPGADVMKRLRGEIRYLYSDLARGAQIRIVTKNAEALKAVHEFLLFQIRDHHTGDPQSVTSPPPGKSAE